MTSFVSLRTGVCLAAILAAPAARADVTAQDVWSSWQEVFSVYGDNAVTTESVDTASDSVTVTGLAIAMEDDATAFRADVGDIAITENGDGTVSISMADSYPMVVTGEDGITVSMTVSQTDMDITVSGDPKQMDYDLSAARYAISVDEISGPEGPLESDIMIAANALSGNYRIGGTAEMRDIAYAISADTLDLLVDVTDPGNSGSLLVSGKIEGIAGSAQVLLPSGAGIDTPDSLFVDGLSVEGGYSLQSGSYIFDFNDDGDQVAGSVSSGSSNLAVSMSKDRVGYDVSTRDVMMELSSQQMPFPVDVTVAEYGFGFSAPVSATQEPAPFSARINLSDLNVNDEVWMMADPSGALPHTPVTLRLDLRGQAQMFFDMFDPEQADAMVMSGLPGELHALAINELTLRAAGAEVTGEGGFTFDNSDMQTIPGVPRPEGAVTVNITGANALIDGLVAMGVLPEDQAMMGRMMMGMFARTVGEDQLSSTIEINEQGHIIANGQRIQ